GFFSFSIKLKYLTFLLSSVSAEDNGGSLDQFRCLCISILLDILPGCIMMPDYISRVSRRFG
ncbi:hypothetical protein ACN0QC_005553, partial [Escherichia coli]